MQRSLLAFWDPYLVVVVAGLVVSMMVKVAVVRMTSLVKSSVTILVLPMLEVLLFSLAMLTDNGGGQDDNVDDGASTTTLALAAQATVLLPILTTLAAT